MDPLFERRGSRSQRSQSDKQEGAARSNLGGIATLLLTGAGVVFSAMGLIPAFKGDSPGKVANIQVRVASWVSFSMRKVGRVTPAPAGRMLTRCSLF